MRRFCGLSIGAMAALLALTSPVFAFEELPPAPPPEAGETAPAAPQVAPPTFQFQTPGTGIELGADNQAAEVFSFGILPKLDFGLELLYSDRQPELEQPGLLPEEAQDITVMGKVKRRF